MNNLMNIAYQEYPVPTSDSLKSRFIGVGYIRVSGDPQASDDKVSLDVQKKDIEKKAKGNGWQFLDTYKDVLTGALMFENRIGGKQLIEDAMTGKFNLVIVWDYDRIGRDMEGLAAKLFRHKMRQLGIQIYSLNQPSELKDPEEYKENPYDDGQILLETIHDWQSASTITKFRHRSMMGRTERAKKGKMLNTPPYGYKLEPLKDENGNIVIRKDGRIVYKRVIEPKEATIVIRIYREYVYENKSMNEIRDGLNADKVPTRKGGAWERAMVARILKNPVYYGALIYNRYHRRKNALTGQTKWGKNSSDKWIIVPPDQTEHKGIIDKPLFDKAQEIRLSKLRLGAVAVYSDFLLSGLPICNCGSKMYRTKVRSYYKRADGVTTKSQSNGYVCGRWQRFRDQDRNYISERDLLKAILDDLKKFKGNPNTLEGFLSESDKKEIDEKTARLGVLMGELSKVEPRYSRLRKAYEMEILNVEQFGQAVDDLEKEQTGMKQEIERLQEELKNEQKRELNREDFKQAIENFETIFNDGDIKAQKSFLRGIIDNILVDEGEVVINYSI